MPRLLPWPVFSPHQLTAACWAQRFRGDTITSRLTIKIKAWFMLSYLKEVVFLGLTLNCLSHVPVPTMSDDLGKNNVGCFPVKRAPTV